MAIYLGILRYFLLSFIISILLFSCSEPTSEEEHEEVHGREIHQKIKKSLHDSTNSYEAVVRRKKLIAATSSNSVNYYIYRGETMGYQYEMLK